MCVGNELVARRSTRSGRQNGTGEGKKVWIEVLCASEKVILERLKHFSCTWIVTRDGGFRRLEDEV